MVTEADIEEFEANYRGSDSEKNDLIDLYEKFKGNMNRWGCYVLFPLFFSLSYRCLSDIKVLDIFYAFSLQAFLFNALLRS